MFHRVFRCPQSTPTKSCAQSGRPVQTHKSTPQKMGKKTLQVAFWFTDLANLTDSPRLEESSSCRPKPNSTFQTDVFLTDTIFDMASKTHAIAGPRWSHQSWQIDARARMWFWIDLGYFRAWCWADLGSSWGRFGIKFGADSWRRKPRRKPRHYEKTLTLH